MKKYIFILLLSFQSLLAQVQFEARVSKTTLGLNERLRIDFAMNVDGDNFMQPSFDGFRVIAGPSQQVSQSWINGKSSFEKIYFKSTLGNSSTNFWIKFASGVLTPLKYLLIIAGAWPSLTPSSLCDIPSLFRNDLSRPW